jgi:hypothetical protein
MILVFTAGLVIGTVAGTVSWVAAAAYLEAQRLNPTMVAAMTDAELAAFSIEKRYPLSAEQAPPAGRLYHRRRNQAAPIAASDPARKARDSSL